MTIKVKTKAKSSPFEAVTIEVLKKMVLANQKMLMASYNMIEANHSLVMIEGKRVDRLEKKRKTKKPIVAVLFGKI